MGWTFFASRGRSTVDILKETFATTNANGSWVWLDHAVRGTTVYAVLRYTPAAPSDHSDSTYQQEPEGSYRFIAVFLTSRRGDGTYDFGYKDMTEGMGPCERDCPARLIKCASPLRDDYAGYARQWRLDCATKRTEQSQNKKTRPQPGQCFRTNKPVSFKSGAQHSEFKCTQITRRGRKRTVYTTLDNTSFYCFRPEEFGFVILDNPATIEPQQHGADRATADHST